MKIRYHGRSFMWMRRFGGVMLPFTFGGQCIGGRWPGLASERPRFKAFA